MKLIQWVHHLLFPRYMGVRGWKLSGVRFFIVDNFLILGLYVGFLFAAMGEGWCKDVLLCLSFHIKLS